MQQQRMQQQYAQGREMEDGPQRRQLNGAEQNDLVSRIEYFGRKSVLP